VADPGAAVTTRRAIAGLNVQLIEALLSCVSLSGDCRLPSLARVLQPDRQVGGRELVACFLWPLDKAYIIPVERIAKACINPFMWIFEPIEIKMMQV
jgi:hypothetical protein